MVMPYTSRPKRLSVALLVGPDACITTEKRIPLEDAIKRGFRVYARQHFIRKLVVKGYGSCILYRYEPVRWGPGRDSWPVIALPFPWRMSAEEAVEEIARWAEWVQDEGGRLGSLGATGFSLLKASLKEPLSVSRGERLPIHYCLGGRQICGPAFKPEIIDCYHYDLQAAYARQLSSALYGGGWVKIDATETRRLLGRKMPAGRLFFVTCDVEIPELHFGPLPRRPIRYSAAVLSLLSATGDLYPISTRISGTWTAEEVLQALKMGCKIIRIRRGYIHVSNRAPFMAWFEKIWRGRELGDYAGFLAKACGNATWGQLALAPKASKRVFWKDGCREIKFSVNPDQKAYDLGEWITGNVRARLAYACAKVGDDLVSAHTDGFWSSIPVEIPGWRLKDHAKILRILNPQSYAFLDESGWHYSVSGTLTPKKEFERRWLALGLSQDEGIPDENLAVSSC